MKRSAPNSYESRISVTPTPRRADSSTVVPSAAVTAAPAAANGRATSPCPVSVPLAASRPTSADAHGRAASRDQPRRTGQASRLAASSVNDAVAARLGRGPLARRASRRGQRGRPHAVPIERGHGVARGPAWPTARDRRLSDRRGRRRTGVRRAGAAGRDGRRSTWRAAPVALRAAPAALRRAVEASRRAPA